MQHKKALTGRNFRGEVISLLRRELGDPKVSVVFSSDGIKTRSFIGKGEPVRFTHREITLISYQCNEGMKHWVARSTVDPQGRGSLSVIQTR